MAKKHYYLLAWVLLSVILASPLLYGQKSQKFAPAPKTGGVLRVRPFSPGPFQPQLDPLRRTNIFVVDQLFDGLVRLDNKLNLVPSLAEYWTISEDGRRYVFYLRKGVKFHHGRELDAEDVKFSLERILHPDSPLPIAQSFASRVVGALEYRQGKAEKVAGFRVLGPHLFEIQWKNPYLSALYFLSMASCKILPQELVLSQGENFFYKPSGTGPFKFAHWLRSPRLDIVGVRLERNEGYFGAKPYLEAVEFSPYFTLDHFLNDEVHIIPYLSEKLSNADCQVLESENFLTTFLAMSCHLPPLDRAAVRRAISAALDKKELARAAFRLDMIPQVTHNFIPARLPGFYPSDEADSFNPTQAKRMLAEEGFLEPGDFPSFLLFFMLPREEEHLKIYRTLRDQLGSLGIKLKMKYFRSFSELKPYREPYFVFLELRMDFPDPENLVLPLFASRGTINQELMHYASSEVDELLQRAEVERSWRERITLFQKIEKILAAELPAIPLFSKQQRLAVKPYVRGVKVPALGFYYLNAEEVWLEK